MTAEPLRFFFYSHDGLGLGHVRRHLAIAAALVKLHSNARILLATSIDEVSRLGLPSNVDTLKLPGLRKVANEQYASRRLGLRSSEILALRSALLQSAIKAFRPAVVLADKHPLGVGGEFLVGLQTAKQQGTQAVLGLRDILDEPTAVLREWSAGEMRQWITQLYDSILVYGSRAVFDPVEQYLFDVEMGARTRFCGYVVNSNMPGNPSPELADIVVPNGPVQTVLATTGGGEDGFEVLGTFIEAARGAEWRGVAVTGPLLSDDQVEALASLASGTGVRLLKFIPALSRLFPSVDALVCMGGYNTLTEAAADGLPAVCVPRVAPRAEQLLRAERFAKLGLLRVIHPRDLSVERLREHIDLALRTPRYRIQDQAKAVLRLDGAMAAAKELLAVCCGTSFLYKTDTARFRVHA